jgi:hypothetical protein
MRLHAYDKLNSELLGSYGIDGSDDGGYGSDDGGYGSDERNDRGRKNTCFE